MNITNEMIEAARLAYNANTPTIIPRGGKLAHETKLMHTILSAVLSAQTVVKPLEWACSPEWKPGELVGEWFVYSVAGHYRIWHDDTVSPAVWHVSYPVGSEQPYDGTEHATLEAAKAAAQADHDARILSALTTPPAPASSEPVAWTGSGSIMALKDCRKGFIWPTKGDAHPIPLYAHPPAPTGDGWRPIETAPKDGTRILFWDQDCEERAVIGAYLHGRWWPEGEDNVKVAPRGWMPLPAAPTPPKEGGR